MSDRNERSERSRRSVLKASAKGGLGAGAFVAIGSATAAASCPIVGCGVIVNDTPLYAVAEGDLSCDLRYIDGVLEADTEVHVSDCCGGSTPTAYYVIDVSEDEEGWIEASDIEPC